MELRGRFTRKRKSSQVPVCIQGLGGPVLIAWNGTQYVQLAARLNTVQLPRLRSLRKYVPFTSNIT
jgi:hypothetical protein